MFGNLDEALTSARDQNEIMAASGKLSGKDHAKARERCSLFSDMDASFPRTMLSLRRWR
jgi:hypothetical protein